METNIPTNRSKEGKTIFADEELIKSLASYEQAKRAYEKGFNSETDYYWFNNRAWSVNYPIGIMNNEDAFDRQSKGIAFIDFDDTIPAPTQEELLVFLLNLD